MIMAHAKWASANWWAAATGSHSKQPTLRPPLIVVLS